MIITGGCLIALLLTAAMLGSRSTCALQSFTYPVSVQLPPGATPREIGYECFFDHDLADFVIADLASSASAFDRVDSSTFDASVRGSRTTRWYGILKKHRKESTIVVRVETTDGNLLVGLAELPAEEGPVTVSVHQAP